MKKEVNPLTGAVGESCHVFDIVDIAKAPELAAVAKDPIYQKVFGAMEQLRIEETLHCKDRKRGMSLIGEPKFTIQRHIGDLSYSGLVQAWFSNSGGWTYLNFTFPINTEGYY